MLSTTRNYKIALLLFIFVLPITSFSSSHTEHTEEAAQDNTKDNSETANICGILENFVGDVQILDSTRTHLVNGSMRAVVPCGSWVSVNYGWAQVRHQLGPYIHLSEQTFVQFIDFKNSTAPSSFRDHLVVYRGQIFVRAGGGDEEFRILSASSRARIKRGKTVFIFNRDKQETQLIALENTATLENRFEMSKKITVREGEASELNFKLGRVIPTFPKAVSVASLRPKLAQLRVTETDQLDAIRAVIRRQSRKFAAHLGTELTRQPASKKKEKTYLRHPASEDDPKLREHLVTKTAGGEQIGETILFPDKYYGRTQRVRVETKDPLIGRKIPTNPQEEAEKKRLIDELSLIRAD